MPRVYAMCISMRPVHRKTCLVEVSVCVWVCGVYIAKNKLFVKFDVWIGCEHLGATKNIPDSFVNATCAAAIEHRSCHILSNNYIKHLYAYIIEEESGDEYACARTRDQQFYKYRINFILSQWVDKQIYWTDGRALKRGNYIIIAIASGVGGSASM